MKLLADENVDQPIIEWLRAAGHDVTWIAETQPGATDRQVLDMACADDRCVLAFDLDFGELIFRQQLTALGVIILRLRMSSFELLLDRLRAAWNSIERNAAGHLVVVTHDQIRTRPLPAGGENG